MQWKTDFIEDIESIVQTSTTNRPKYSACASGTGKWCLTPVICLPCVVWSAMWRCVACPFQCLFYGPHMCISNNGCTDPTDQCVKSSCSVFDQQVKPALEYVDGYCTDNTCKEDVNEVLRYAYTKLLNKDFLISYKVAEYIHPYVVRLLRDECSNTPHDMKIAIKSLGIV